MTPPPPPPTGSRRRSGHRRRQQATSGLPVAVLIQSGIALALVVLVVVILMSKWPGDGAPQAAGGDNGTAATSGGTNGGDGAGSGGVAVAGEKILKLADHPMMQDQNAGLQNIICTLPTWHSDEESAELFFTAATRCLNDAWGPFLEYYHLPFVAPTLHFPTGTSFQTACGTIAVGVATAAYYCDNNLYVPYRGLQIDQYGDDPGVYLALIAHEYGHHVQEIAGIMDAVWQQIYADGQLSPTGLDLSRRKELQAQCFSGMFLGAVVNRGGSISQDMYAKAWRDQDTRGDNTSGSHDHGTNAHYATWWRAGAQYNRITKCNTFAAPGSDVS